VEVYSVTLGGAKEHLTEQEGEATKELIDLVARQFAEQGCTAQASSFGAKESEKSAELFRETWLRESSQYISGSLHQSPQTTPATLSGVNLGDEAKNVAHESGTDGLILIICQAEQRSGGSIGAELAGKALVGIATAGLFVPAADPAGKIVVDAALVDGKSGKIVWANSGASVKMTFVGSVLDKTTLEDLIKRLFATLRQ
jgi:hypothetical protein